MGSSDVIAILRKTKYLGGHPDHREPLDGVHVELLQDGVCLKTRKAVIREMSWSDVKTLDADDMEGLQRRVSGARVALLGPFALMAKKKRVLSYLTITDDTGDWLFEVQMSPAELRADLAPARGFLEQPQREDDTSTSAEEPLDSPTDGPTHSAPGTEAQPSPVTSTRPDVTPSLPSLEADAVPQPSPPEPAEEPVERPDVVVPTQEERIGSEPAGASDSSLARRLRRVEEATDGYDAYDQPDEQLAEDAAKWQALALAGGEFAIAASKGEIGAGTIALVRALLDVEEAQARLLESIDENVKLLRDGPFKTGRLYLAEANRLVESPDRSVKFVERAQEQFYQAHALTADPMDSAAVEMHIGLTAILLDEPEDALHWLEQAYEKTAVKARELAAHTGNTKVMSGKSQAALLAATMGYGIVVIGAKKLTKSNKSKRAQAALRELLPLVRCIASLAYTAGGDPSDLPPLELRKVKRNQYELTEVNG